MPEWVSAHQIPGVWQLGRRDKADTPGLPVLIGDIWRARAEISKKFYVRSCVGQPAEAYDDTDLKEAKALLDELS